MEASPITWILRHFGLMAALVWSANGLVWWIRGTRRHPEKAEGYRRLVTGFLVFGNLPWLYLEAGILSGAIHGVRDLMDDPPSRAFVMAFVGLLVTLLLLGTYWVFAKGGAEALVEHPGLLNYDLESPTALKVGWLIMVAANLLGLSVWMLAP